MNNDEQIIHDLITHKVDLMRYERTVRRRILRRLHDIQQSIKKRLASESESITRQQFRRLLRDIDDILKNEYALLYDDMRIIQDETEEAEKEWLVAYFASLGLASDSRQVEALIAGHTLKESLYKQRDDLNHRLKRAVRVGAVDGLAEINSNIDDAMQQQAHYTSALVATWLASIANNSVFQFAPESVQGWRHVSVLDSKTSAICTARHGKQWGADFEPINHHLPFARPPLHPHCRSMLVPIMLIGDDKLVSGEDWVKKRTLEQLQAQFGKGVGKLLHDGTINLSQAVKHGGLLVATLKDIKKTIDPYFIEPIIDTKALKGARFQAHKLKRKIKHNDTFGGNTVSQKAENIYTFQQSIIRHLNDENTIERGYYAQVKGSKVCYNKITNVAVVFDKDNNFITTYKPNTQNGQLDVYLQTGRLR